MFLTVIEAHGAAELGGGNPEQEPAAADSRGTDGRQTPGSRVARRTQEYEAESDGAGDPGQTHTTVVFLVKGSFIPRNKHRRKRKKSKEKP